MNFKSFLLLEDPNEVSKNPRTGREKVTAKSPFAVTFILFKDYYVYTPTAKGGFHNDLVRWLVFRSEGFEKEFQRYNPWVKAIKEYGHINTHAAHCIKSVSPLVDGKRDIDGRTAMLAVNPQVILGRLWVDKSVVSFWNHWPRILQASSDVLKFVSFFGDPKRFEYDVRNIEVSYDDILNKVSLPKIISQ
jgi:hypothetical protein